MNSVILIVSAVFLFCLGFLIGNGFYDAVRYTPKVNELEQEIRKFKHEAEIEKMRREAAERHQVFEHVFKIETDSEKCDLFEPW